jgi:hypothetical protein
MVLLEVIMTSLFWISSVYCADELITLNPRPGVTQHVLLWGPSSLDSRLVILILPGGGGNLWIKSGDKIERETEYLFSRHRNLLIRQAVAVAVVDAPSDHPNMDQKFRKSITHIEDMTAVVKELKTAMPRQDSSFWVTAAGQFLQLTLPKHSAIGLQR